MFTSSLCFILARYVCILEFENTSLYLLHVGQYRNCHRKSCLSSHCLLDSLVVECWLPVREVAGSIPSQGPHHTKDVIKMVPVVPLFSTDH